MKGGNRAKHGRLKASCDARKTAISATNIRVTPLFIQKRTRIRLLALRVRNCVSTPLRGAPRRRWEQLGDTGAGVWAGVAEGRCAPPFPALRLRSLVATSKAALGFCRWRVR
eukprot:4850636-Pleurochrysis_carterae.AAC.1